MTTTTLSCRCGACRLEVAGRPIQAVICHCASCRAAAARIEALPGAVAERTAEGGTPYAMVRKDRLRVVSGAEHLAGFRLTPDAPTRRAVATCCNSFVFTDFRQGHWVSISAARWPAASRPVPQLRTMTGDDANRAALPADMPNPASHSVAFMWRLVLAWARMGFRTPKLDYPAREMADA